MGLKHQAAFARKWRAAIRDVEQHFPAYLPPLMFLTDPQRIKDPISAVAHLPAGAGVIYRHFGAEDRTDVAGALSEICQFERRPLLIAADPILALSMGADGVHWPEARLSDARHWRGHFRLQTASAHSARAIRRAAISGMDAALVSSVFPSNSPSAGTPLNRTRFRMLARQATLPVYGLGGVDSHNAGQISGRAGISGVSSFACLSGAD